MARSVTLLSQGALNYGECVLQYRTQMSTAGGSVETCPSGLSSILSYWASGPGMATKAVTILSVTDEIARRIAHRCHCFHANVKTCVQQRMSYIRFLADWSDRYPGEYTVTCRGHLTSTLEV